MSALDPETLDRRIGILFKVDGTGIRGAGKGGYAAPVPVWANVQELLPSRGDKMADGLQVQRRPTRIRIRYRTDIGPGTRFGWGDRVLDMITPPVELGFREGLEILAHDTTTTGNPT